MLHSATSFILKRKKVVSITDNRINNILWYIIECYSLLLKDNPKYSKKYVSKKTTLHFEDYLKIRLVEDYLKKNKALLISKVSALEEITFHYETVKGFTDILDGKEKSDKIDIYVNKLGLKRKWAVEDEDLYFAIECKRIKVLSDCKDYLDDTQNFVNRKYNALRLPFEGQLAFIEDGTLTHISISTEINKRLKASSTIITKQFLSSKKINNSFNGCYPSIHKRNHGKKELFTIFHLLFDYSKIIVN